MRLEIARQRLLTHGVHLTGTLCHAYMISVLSLYILRRRPQTLPPLYVQPLPRMPAGDIEPVPFEGARDLPSGVVPNKRLQQVTAAPFNVQTSARADLRRPKDFAITRPKTMASSERISRVGALREGV